MRGVGFVLYFSLTGQDHSPQQGGVSITEVTVQHASFAKPHYVRMMAELFQKGMVLWQEKTIEEEI